VWKRLRFSKRRPKYYLVLRLLYNEFTMATPSLTVPTIDVRKRIPNSVIRELTRQIAKQFKPQKIILFGSYARGKPRPESDVDLLVVMDTKLREVEQSIKICQQLDYMFGLDLIVYTPKHLKERVKMGDWFLRDVLKEGKVLYESRSR
jgi:predicted nucleotidyltransferase